MVTNQKQYSRVFSTVFIGATLIAQSANAQSSFVVHPPVPVPNIMPGLSATAADFDADGDMDLLVPQTLGLPFKVGKLFRRTGSTFQTTDVPALIPTTTALSFPGVVSLTSGDLNGDLLPDLVGVTSQGWVFTSINQGQTATRPGFLSTHTLLDFSPYTSGVTGPNLNAFVQLVDLNQDDILDLVIVGSVQSFFGQSSLSLPLTLMIGNGDGTFQLPQFISTSLSSSNMPVAMDLQFADFDHDGRPETLAVLWRTTGYYSSQSHIETFTAGTSGWISNGTVLLLGGLGFATQMRFGDTTGDGISDWTVSFSRPQVSGGSAQTQSDVFIFQGSMYSSQPYTFSDLASSPLNAGMGQARQEVLDIRLADTNDDNILDVTVLIGRGIQSEATLERYLGSANGLSPTPLVLNLGAKTFMPNEGQPNDYSFPAKNGAGMLSAIGTGSAGNAQFAINGLYLTSSGANYPHVVFVENTNSGGLGPNPKQVEYVGQGRPNRAGKVPRTVPMSDARIGNFNFGLAVNDLPGDGTVVSLNGSDIGIPSINVGPNLDVEVLNVASSALQILTHSGADGGYYRYKLPIPNVPALIGSDYWFQLVYADPTMLATDPFPVFDSQAVRVRIGF